MGICWEYEGDAVGNMMDYDGNMKMMLLGI